MFTQSTYSMCFHFKQSKSIEFFKARGLNGHPVNGVYNGFSHPNINVVTQESPKEIKHFMWGLIPSWAKNDDIKKYTLNARYETLKTKPSFKNAKRCLIFSDGFYEWKWLDKQGKKKQKYLIELPNSELFSFAGLYDHWVDKQTGEIINSCSIVTTEAKGIMREIHNSKMRMPLIIENNQMDDWLENRKTNLFYNFKTFEI